MARSARFFDAGRNTGVMAAVVSGHYGAGAVAGSAATQPPLPRGGAPALHKFRQPNQRFGPSLKCAHWGGGVCFRTMRIADRARSSEVYPSTAARSPSPLQGRFGRGCRYRSRSVGAWVAPLRMDPQAAQAAGSQKRIRRAAAWARVAVPFGSRYSLPSGCNPRRIPRLTAQARASLA